MILFLLGLIAPLAVLVGCIIVDDTSQLISYSNTPSWAVGNPSQLTAVIKWAGNSGGSAYGDTWHEAVTRSSSLSFQFTGTAVSVVGIVPKGVDSRIGVSIDGGTETFYTNTHTVITENQEDFMYGVQVFSTSGLGPSSHKLVLTGYGLSFVFGLDYIEYTPVDAAASSSQSSDSSAQTTASGTTSQASLSSASTSSISGITASGASTSNLSTLPGVSISAGSDLTSDRPTIQPSDSRIIYSLSQQWATNTSCNLSSRVTSTVGASFAFDFIGPDIWVYTATNQQGAKYKVTINGTDVGEIETTGSTCKVEASFHMGNLDNSNHTLLLTNLGPSGREIDFVGLRLASSVDQTTGNALPQDGGVNKAAIAGGVTGGVAVLLLLSFVIYMRYRRQREEETLTIENTDSVAPIVQPSRGFPLNEKQQLLAAERAINVERNLPAYEPHAKPPLPEWAIAPSHDGSGGSSSIYHAESSTSQHQFLAANTTNMDHVYQAYTKPPVPTWATNESSGENIGSHHDEVAISQRGLLMADTTSSSNMYQAYIKPSFPEWAIRPSHDDLGENTNIDAEAPTFQQQLIAADTASAEHVHQSYSKPPVPTWANGESDRENIIPHHAEATTSRQQLLPADRTSAEYAYQSYRKPPVPTWANGENARASIGSYHDEATISQQRLLAARTDHAYQSYRKPPVPIWANNEHVEENVDSHPAEPAVDQQQQDQRASLPSLPPSFRTRPTSGRSLLAREHDGHPIHSTTPFYVASSNNLHPFDHSAEEDSSAEMVYDDEAPLSSAPPYVEDVLARPDARNLSETDVDTIARRLAEVMRIQRRARGGPGLLRERAAPPRELLDRLVEEHLGAREDTS